MRDCRSSASHLLPILPLPLIMCHHPLLTDSVLFFCTKGLLCEVITTGHLNSTGIYSILKRSKIHPRMSIPSLLPFTKIHRKATEQILNSKAGYSSFSIQVFQSANIFPYTKFQYQLAVYTLTHKSAPTTFLTIHLHLSKE